MSVELKCSVCRQPVLYGSRHHHCGSAVMALERRIEELRAALLKYGRHTEACYEPKVPFTLDCTCGFDDIKSQLNVEASTPTQRKSLSNQHPD